MIALVLFDVLVPIVFAAWVAFLVAVELTTVRRGRRRVEHWAAAASCQLLSVRLRRVRTGPFGYGFNNWNRVFEVVVAQPNEEPRTAFLKVGGGLFGLAADKVEARWVSGSAS